MIVQGNTKRYQEYLLLKIKAHLRAFTLQHNRLCFHVVDKIRGEDIFHSLFWQSSSWKCKLPRNTGNYLNTTSKWSCRERKGGHLLTLCKDSFVFNSQNLLPTPGALKCTFPSQIKKSKVAQGLFFLTAPPVKLFPPATLIFCACMGCVLDVQSHFSPVEFCSQSLFTLQPLLINASLLCQRICLAKLSLCSWRLSECKAPWEIAWKAPSTCKLLRVIPWQQCLCNFHYHFL